MPCSFRYYSKRLQPGISPGLGNAPAVTIIRPVKGLEPQLYDCIASTFRQVYPKDKISIRLCIEDVSDPAYPLLKKLINDFPDHDAQVLVEADDPILHGPGGSPKTLGPNPKIRNISRAYREAKGDIIWVIDCNVWVAKGVLGRMVDRLMGYTSGGGSSKPYKFVHQLPLEVDIVDYSKLAPDEKQPSNLDAPGVLSKARANGGGRLDEMFMATTHAKFYAAINAVGIAPCIVGKSNMFRKSHLDRATDPSLNPILPRDDKRRPGVDYFSYNICEDHLIGDILWRTNIPGYLNHGNTWGDLVIQPMAGMTVPAYVGRRVRWLRARKFTVLAATLVEPGVESLLACAHFAFAATTLPWFEENLGISRTWSAMGKVWALAVLVWICVDRLAFLRLHSGLSIQVDENTPLFAQGSSNTGKSRTLSEWGVAWVGREVMAMPIWTWAVMLGKTVNWRGKTFTVRLDTTVVEEATDPKTKGASTPELEKAKQKARLD